MANTYYTAMYAVDKKSHAFGLGDRLPWSGAKTDLEMLFMEIEKSDIVLLTRNMIKTIPNSFFDEIKNKIQIVSQENSIESFYIDDKYKGSDILILGGHFLFQKCIDYNIPDKIIVNELSFMEKDILDWDCIGPRINDNYIIKDVNVIYPKEKSNHGKYVIKSILYKRV